MGVELNVRTGFVCPIFIDILTFPWWQEMEVQGITQHVAMAIAGSSVYGLQGVGSSSSNTTTEYDSGSKVCTRVCVCVCVFVCVCAVG